MNSDLIWHFNEQEPAHYDLFNVRYVIAPSTQKMPGFLTVLKKTKRYTLYEATTSGYAEFALSTQAGTAASEADLLAQNKNWLFGDGPKQRRFIIYSYGGAIPPQDLAKYPPDPPDGRILAERVQPGRIELNVEHPQGAVLVIKTTYHPKWIVSIDAQPRESFMVSPSFIGVYVPPGRHQVVAEYRSGPLKIVLPILGGLVLAGVMVFGRRLEDLGTRLESIASGVVSGLSGKRQT